MTKDEFSRLLNTVSVQLVSPYQEHRGGIYLEGITQEELSKIVTIAGQSLGAIQPEVDVNPKWLELGPERNMHFIFHREALESNG